MTTTLIAILVATSIVILATIVPTYVISAKKKTTEEDWAIANRSLPTYVVVGTQFASAMGGGVLVAHLGNAYNNGVGVLLYGALVCSVFLVIMGLGRWLRSNNYTTIPEILGTFTGNNKLVRIFAAVMSLIVPYGWITSQITAFGNIYSTLTGLDYTMICIVFAAVSLLFVLPSGLKTVAWTDFFLGCFMLLICGICIVFTIKKGGGWSNIAANLNAIDPNLLSFSGSLKNNIGAQAALLWIFAVLPGGMTNQCYYQRVCAIDSEKHVNKSLILSAVVVMISYFWAIFMGVSIRSINPATDAPTAWFMGQLPLVLMALFAALVFATIMSSLSTGVQTCVMNITRDLLPIIKPDLSEKKTLNISRILSVALMIIALIMCLALTDTLTWLTATYAYSAATLACPIFLSHAFRNKKWFITTPGIIAGMIGGGVGCVVGTILKTAVNYAAIGIAFSFIAMMATCALTHKKPQEA